MTLVAHLADWLGPLLVLVVLALVFTGYPVAFAIGGASVAFALLRLAAGYFDAASLLAPGDRLFGIMQTPCSWRSRTSSLCASCLCGRGGTKRQRRRSDGNYIVIYFCYVIGSIVLGIGGV